MMKKRHIGIIALAILLLANFTVCQGAAPTSTDTGTEVTETQVKTEKATTDKKTGSVDMETYTQLVADKVKNHWPHMDQVWPGYDYANHNLVLFYLDENGETQKAWNINTRGSTELSADAYQNIIPPQPGGYTELSFQEKPSIAMSFDAASLEDAEEDALQLYLTASHELVHFYYQNLSMGGSVHNLIPSRKPPDCIVKWS